jgi:hypothetical protein
MSSKNKQVLKANPEETKRFAYELGNCTLSFGLRVDIKDQLADYEKLLVRAAEDVRQELKRRFPMN